MDDPTFNTLLIIAANTLITYFLLRQQDARLSNQAHEHQTIFSDTYLKKIKALENLVQRFFAVEGSLVPLARGTMLHIMSNGERLPGDYESEDREMRTRLSDLREFYQSNRHFFPEHVNEQVSDILTQVYGMVIAVSLIGREPLLEDVPQSLLEILDELPDDDEFDLKNPVVLLAHITAWMGQLAKQMDNLYKSEAGIKS